MRPDNRYRLEYIKIFECDFENANFNLDFVKINQFFALKNRKLERESAHCFWISWEWETEQSF